MAPIEKNILAELKVNRLPSLPHVLIDMLQACQGSHASFQSISVIISRDAAISARVVSLANSSFFNRGNKITSLERALLVLGTDTVKTIVITASIQQFFSGFNNAHTRFLKQFWKRSLSCALISKSLAILTGYPNPEEAYLTGLLHNIGELVLETNYSTQFAQLIAEPISEMNRVAKEMELFSTHHAQVGSWLAKGWGLSDFTADAIEFHHAPAEAIQDAHHLVKLIYLASLLSDESSSKPQPDFDIAENLFELNPSLVNEIVLKIASEVQEIASSLGIDISHPEPSESDHKKQIALAEQVRNIGLLQTATAELNRASSKLELSRAFQTTLELLFGASNSAVFWYQANSNELTFVMPELPESAPIKFKLEAHRSIVAAAAISGDILCSFDYALHHDSLPVVDQQVMRLVAAKGLICVPIKIQEALFCVLVVGSNQALAQRPNHAQLLKYFATEIALSCKETLSHINACENKTSTSELSMRANEIAHEASNPLNIISNYLSALAIKLADQKELHEELNILKEEVERTTQILFRLRDLNHSTKDSAPGVELNNEINNLISLYRSSLFLTHDIDCELDLDPLLHRHPSNRNHFKQVLTNLVKNAVEAMPEGGRIRISTASCVNVNGKDFVEIRIQDTGPGISQSILRDLFKPVTSTKGKGHSGLGLSITKNLVTDAHGSISCRSSKQGTEFQILLPTKF